MSHHGYINGISIDWRMPTKNSIISVKKVITINFCDIINKQITYFHKISYYETRITIYIPQFENIYLFFLTLKERSDMQTAI